MFEVVDEDGWIRLFTNNDVIALGLCRENKGWTWRYLRMEQVTFTVSWERRRSMALPLPIREGCQCQN